MENIDINIDIDKEDLKKIDVDMAIFENIDQGILQNIDIDKILYRLGFGISNTPSRDPSGRLAYRPTILKCWSQYKSDGKHGVK